MSVNIHRASNWGKGGSDQNPGELPPRTSPTLLPVHGKSLDKLLITVLHYSVIK